MLQYCRLLDVLLPPNEKEINMRSKFVQWLALQGKEGILLVAESGNMQVMKALMVEVSTETMKEGFLSIVESGNVQLVEVLMKVVSMETMKATKQMFMYRNRGVWTALHLVASKGHCAMCNALLKLKVYDVNQGDRWGCTPLSIAASYGYTEVVNALLKAGADVNQARTDSEATPLIMAATFGYMETVNVLLEAGAVMNLRDKSGSTALWMAAQNGHVEVVKALVKFKMLHAPEGQVEVALNHVALKIRCTALYIAAQNGHLEMVKVLLDAGAAVNLSTIKGCTPLWIAAQNGHVEVVKVLLNASAAVNLSDDDESTPLVVAAAMGNMEVVKVLVKHGADLTRRGQHGKTAIDWAHEKGYYLIVDVLRKAHMRKQEHTNTQQVLRRQQSLQSGGDHGSGAGGGSNHALMGGGRLQSGGDNRLQAVAVRSVQDAKKDAYAANGSWHQGDADMPARRVIFKRIMFFLKARSRTPTTLTTQEWLKRLPNIAACLEASLYRTAETKEQYLNVDTLNARLHAVASRERERRRLEQGETNGVGHVNKQNNK